MKNLFILKTIIEDKRLSAMAFTVWCGLRNIMVKDVKEYYISYNLIGYSLFGRVIARKELDAIKKGFSELVGVGYVKVLEPIGKSEFIVDLSALYYEQGYFANLSAEEMQKILNLDCSQDKYKLLRYFTCQVGTFNQSLEGVYKGKIGGMGLDNFVSILGYSKVSIISYNELLLAEKILFVYSHGDFYKFDDGTLREIPNTYARYSDRGLAQEYMSRFSGHKDSFKKNDEANWRRSMAQKLIAFQKGKEYDIETIKQLYIYSDERNRYLKIDYDFNIERGNSPDEPQYIDMSIFDDYLLEIGEA